MAWGIIRAFEDVPDEEEYMSYSDDEDEGEDGYYYYDDVKEPEYYPSSVSSPSCSSCESSPITPRSRTESLGHIQAFSLPALPVAYHPWPGVFGKAAEPVRSHWLVSFEQTALLLQQKAYIIASGM